MTVAPHVLPDPTQEDDAAATSARAGWLPGLASVTRLVGAPASPLWEPPSTATTTGREPVLALVPDVPARTPGPPRVVPAAAARRGGHHSDLRLVEGGPEQTAAWAMLFCQTVVEVVAGDRNPQQLIRRLDAAVYDALLARRHQLQRVSRRHRRQPVRAQVRSVRISHPTPLVAEVAARVEHGQRSRAMAVRLEIVGGRWTCTALELG